MDLPNVSENNVTPLLVLKYFTLNIFYDIVSMLTNLKIMNSGGNVIICLNYRDFWEL